VAAVKEEVRNKYRRISGQESETSAEITTQLSIGSREDTWKVEELRLSIWFKRKGVSHLPVDILINTF
jgi:hypothetical protein